MAFSRSIIAAIDRDKILRIRAGSSSDHRFIGIWSVVVGGRVFVRSWSLTRGGWYRTFLDDPDGTIRIGEREVRIRAVAVHGTRVLDAIERAYAEKYTTLASRRYVRGFRTKRRRAATLELRR
jgi:hypothetical protein